MHACMHVCVRAVHVHVHVCMCDFERERRASLPPPRLVSHGAHGPGTFVHGRTIVHYYTAVATSDADLIWPVSTLQSDGAISASSCREEHACKHACMAEGAFKPFLRRVSCTMRLAAAPLPEEVQCTAHVHVHRACTHACVCMRVHKLLPLPLPVYAAAPVQRSGPRELAAGCFPYTHTHVHAAAACMCKARLGSQGGAQDACERTCQQSV